jgi:hypothetical protein
MSGSVPPQDYGSCILAKIDAVPPMDDVNDDELAEIENDPNAAVDKMPDDDRVVVLDTVTVVRGPGMYFITDCAQLSSSQICHAES